MKNRIAAIGLTAALASAAVAVPASSASAGDGHPHPGTTSLVEVLAADGVGFDRNWKDFDIVERAALTVLEAKPSSPVGVLADGREALTAFVPTDRAFRRLVRDVTGTPPRNERQTFQAVATLGVDTIEAVLLYHVVPGATIDSAQAAKSDGARLDTALGETVTVDVRPNRIYLIDKDYDDRNPRLVPKLLDINEGNRQIAHGIHRMLRPIDL
ncbi:fasciclin domain-containing protein [Nocardioides donggukensis]|uniref:Fasciclin domain-containing protein n=1 Tax=Nocardioides donggukensis TaxID=2774019 RepID=A0A927Q0U2_9ACTN|nr:fasciclin domain-containing protein [Nocardioides donggukensis]MBD8869327.1 fasciclin domain-containing protein [Nocardioides donggukensis]